MHSINRPGVLSKTNIPTGVTSPPRDYPSPLIPRHGSLVFHPTEMLYGVGGPDGTGESTRSASFISSDTSFTSARHWVQASLGSYIDHCQATVVLYHDIFPPPLYTSLYSILLCFRLSYCCFHLPFSSISFLLICPAY